MTTVVVSQPMVLPWIGIFEQISRCDVFVHYDDVQLPRGRSFTTRVQAKTADGKRWLTIPVDRRKSGDLIVETIISSAEDWRRSHLNTLQHGYARARHFSQMMSLAKEIYTNNTSSLAEFNIFSLETICRRLGLHPEFKRSSNLNIGGNGSQRLLSICQHYDAATYLTGHGAQNYLDHEIFEQSGIAVSYMDYAPTPWPQIHGTFSPYVTILDMLAAVPVENCLEHFTSSIVPWSEFVLRAP